MIREAAGWVEIVGQCSLAAIVRWLLMTQRAGGVRDARTYRQSVVLLARKDFIYIW